MPQSLVVSGFPLFVGSGLMNDWTWPSQTPESLNGVKLVRKIFCSTVAWTVGTAAEAKARTSVRIWPRIDSSSWRSWLPLETLMQSPVRPWPWPAALTMAWSRPLRQLSGSPRLITQVRMPDAPNRSLTSAVGFSPPMLSSPSEIRIRYGLRQPKRLSYWQASSSQPTSTTGFSALHLLVPLPRVPRYQQRMSLMARASGLWSRASSGRWFELSSGNGSGVSMNPVIVAEAGASAK